MRIKFLFQVVVFMFLSISCASKEDLSKENDQIEEDTQSYSIR